MLLYALVIAAGAISWRGSSKILHDLLYGDIWNLPIIFLMSKFWRNVVMIYSFLVPLLAAVNGYALDGVRGLFVVPFGTWIGMLLTNLFLRFNPIVQFLVFGLMYITLTIFLLFKLF